ncbi:hypothetical protein PG996_011066 [Apiospora saccharicola]|uniref:Uncharacterized protein n=1 Tax=Apiospora saccharicola TaxID=335842 RepID=A0ABR1UE09_9PEZI
MADRIVPAVILARPSSSIREVSIVQYKVSVKVEGVVFIDISLRARLGAAGEGRAVPDFFPLLGDILKLGGEPLDDCLLVVDDLFQVSDLGARIVDFVLRAGYELRSDDSMVARACLCSVVAFIRE